MKKRKTSEPRREVTTVEGISYSRLWWPEGGMTIDETPCNCFGGRRRLHSTLDCPWMKQREMLEGMKEIERTLRQAAQKVTAAALTEWGGFVTPSQCNALFKQVADVAINYHGGVVEVILTDGKRGSVLVELKAQAFTLGGDPEPAWYGSIGVRGGRRGSRPGPKRVTV